MRAPLNTSGQAGYGNRGELLHGALQLFLTETLMELLTQDCGLLPRANGFQEEPCMQANGLAWTHIGKKGNDKLEKIR